MIKTAFTIVKIVITIVNGKLFVVKMATSTIKIAITIIKTALFIVKIGFTIVKTALFVIKMALTIVILGISYPNAHVFARFYRVVFQPSLINPTYFGNQLTTQYNCAEV
jgi:hypothetical protein